MSPHVGVGDASPVFDGISQHWGLKTLHIIPITKATVGFHCTFFFWQGLGGIRASDPSVSFAFFFLRRMGEKKALAHHTSTYFCTRRVSI